MTDITISSISKDAQRIELRSLVNLASEPISHFWPMLTFIHHNPLHGLEHLPFEQAIEQAGKFHGGKGYLSNEQYREYFRQGRITEEAVQESLRPLADHQVVTLGDRKLSHFQVLQALLVHGTGEIPTDISTAIVSRYLEDPAVQGLMRLLESRAPSSSRFHMDLQRYAEKDGKDLATRHTLAQWCDATLGTEIHDQINQEMIKWCGCFLDEGHAPWPMPNREKTFYAGWKILAHDDFSGSLMGIKNWASKIQQLPERPEDTILECLEAVALPRELWSDYFALQMAQLSGWAGLIKWRSEQTDYEWQQAFPIDLVKFMAIRLFYETELLAVVCQQKLGIAGTYPSLLAWMQDHPMGFGLYVAWKRGELPREVLSNLDLRLFLQEPLSLESIEPYGQGVSPKLEQIQKQEALNCQAQTLLHLAHSMNIAPKDFLECDSATLNTLLGWIDLFPESVHGPWWLKAFELSFLKSFVKEIAPNRRQVYQQEIREAQPTPSRPLTQAVFCIDVRSEGFRRHLEEVGGIETYGFAGFFGVPLCFQGFGSEHETDQCPVLLKPKHIVKEIPRAYQEKAAEKYLKRQQLMKTGHTLLHDLKENVITPYVMVEAIGWFFGWRLFGQTLMPDWYQTITNWLQNRFTIPIGTTLTVDKLTNEEAQEMVASEHRATIYRILIERFGRKGMVLPHEHVERLRKQAVHRIARAPKEDDELDHHFGWSESDHENFLRDLRQNHNIHERAVSRRLHRITQTGFTVTEQAHFVETALRIIGLTKSFARLILICAHGSSSDNNPYESALDCGACGGNQGISNARTLAAMANEAQVRLILAQKGLTIPPDTHFIPGQHDTTTDKVVLFDLEDVPATHRKDLLRLYHDLEEAGHNNSAERLTRFPEETDHVSGQAAALRTQRRSIDWAQVRPEWGLSRHTAFIVGRRQLTQGINLEGRTFLHSYDYMQDPQGSSLEIIMTAPMVVGNWINMEHYFSTVDPEVFGSGSKVYHNVVGRVGVMYGTQSDLCVGLPVQTVLDEDKPYHEPMRLFVIIEAPLERITTIIARQDILQRLFGNQWVNLVALDPVSMEFFLFHPQNDWQVIQ